MTVTQPATISADDASQLSTIVQLTHEIREYQSRIERLATERADALVSLHERGYTYRRLGALLDLSAARVGQLITERRNER